MVVMGMYYRGNFVLLLLNNDVANCILDKEFIE
jgi:hypothetical protein